MWGRVGETNYGRNELRLLELVWTVDFRKVGFTEWTAGSKDEKALLASCRNLRLLTIKKPALMFTVDAIRAAYGFHLVKCLECLDLFKLEWKEYHEDYMDLHLKDLEAKNHLAEELKPITQRSKAGSKGSEHEQRWTSVQRESLPLIFQFGHNDTCEIWRIDECSFRLQTF